nr:retrovirus-related Pol polyprotein from transposon TNT 1-94 [Tanacetum cinerariifolium]
MSSHKFDLEKFNGSNDFTLWKVKMTALLVQQGCAVALEGEDKFSKDRKEEVKKEIMAKAHSVILLSVTDEVLREVVDQTKASELWDKLCEKYQNNSHTNGLYQKQRLYTLRMSKSTQIMDTGASHHMTFSRDLFTSFKEWNGTVKLGDDAVLSIKGSEIVQIKMHDGIVRKFDYWFVPGLKKNMISLGTLAKNGLKYHGEGEWVKVSKVFSPMVKHKIIRVLLAMVGTFNLELEHLDVKTAFLHAKNMVVINDLKVLLKSEFEMKDLGAIKKILGMEIWHDRKAGRLCVSQEKYIEKVLQAFFVDRSKPISTPLAAHFKFDRSTIPGTVKEVKYMKTVPYSSAVGSLMYDMACTRPDLAHA